MKKIVLIPLILGSIILAGCQRTVPTDNNTSTTGNQYTGSQNTGMIQPSDNTTAYHFRLNGTEPFRGADISGGNLTVLMPADNVEGNIFSENMSVSEMGDESTLLFTNIDNAAVVTLLQQSCSDGMGPTQYNYKAIMIWSGTVYQGCAISE